MIENPFKNKVTPDLESRPISHITNHEHVNPEINNTEKTKLFLEKNETEKEELLNKNINMKTFWSGVKDVSKGLIAPAIGGGLLATGTAPIIGIAFLFASGMGIEALSDAVSVGKKKILDAIAGKNISTEEYNSIGQFGHLNNRRNGDTMINWSDEEKNSFYYKDGNNT